VALVGESGVGKSTLLNCIAGLESADRGAIRIGPQALDIVRLDETARAALRAQHIGFVFQAFHVLPTLTVAQNISVPLLLCGVPAGEHASRTQAAARTRRTRRLRRTLAGVAVGRRAAAGGDCARAGAPARR
jgi:putative ABC transport system ATP-binding protein